MVLERPYIMESRLGGIYIYPPFDSNENARKQRDHFAAWLFGYLPHDSWTWEKDDIRWYVGYGYAMQAQDKAEQLWPHIRIIPYTSGQRVHAAQSVIPQTDHAMLCVTASAPPEVIRAAYRALSKLYHPDAPQGNHTRMLALNAAYERLRKAGKA